MSSKTFDEFSNPFTLSYRRIYRTLRNIVIIVIALCLMAVFFGIPSVQLTYRHHSTTSGTPTAMDKINADYWNPISGWQVVHAGEAAPGCPLIVFLPLRRCVDVTPYKNPVTLYFLGEEFFYGS